MSRDERGGAEVLFSPAFEFIGGGLGVHGIEAGYEMLVLRKALLQNASLCHISGITKGAGSWDLRVDDGLASSLSSISTQRNESGYLSYLPSGEWLKMSNRER
jgi:hypothetical protein